jgi:pseudoazurin
MRSVLILIGLLALSGTASAADVSVSMLNKASKSNDMYVFEPAIVSIQPGDSVHWTPGSPGHNIEFVAGAIPDGVTPFHSVTSKDASFTFTVPGLYVYKCTPHYGMGMVGVVIVGKQPANLAKIQAMKFPGKGQATVTAAITQAQAPDKTAAR